MPKANAISGCRIKNKGKEIKLPIKVMKKNNVLDVFQQVVDFDTICFLLLRKVKRHLELDFNKIAVDKVNIVRITYFTPGHCCVSILFS